MSVGAGAVGVAHDAHDHAAAIGGQALREGVEHRAQLRLEGGAVAVERDVAGDVHLQLVVVECALDFDRGGGGGLCSHGSLLLLHALGPQVAGDSASSRTDGGAADGVVTTGGVANDGASDGTQARALGLCTFCWV